MGSEILTVIPLHQRPDLIEACADLINQEWKRSQASRIHSLQKSSDDFPVCLVLIKTQRTEDSSEGKVAKTQCQLIGHARLSRVVNQSKSLFVESVVVSKELRGKGHGRKLMEATENYAKLRGFRHLYLTTHDKQHFYTHLGYSLSEPVQSAGAMTSFVSMEFLKIFCAAPQQMKVSSLESRMPNHGLSSFSDGPVVAGSVSPPSSVDHLNPVVLPPPPPPPPHVPSSSSKFYLNSINPLPPPPFPPSLEVSQQINLCSQSVLYGQISGLQKEKSIEQTLLETPYRDVKGLPIFWMKKSI